MTSNIPNKGDMVVNPKTNRMVRVGQSSWKKLVKEGVLPGHYRVDDPNDNDGQKKTKQRGPSGKQRGPSGKSRKLKSVDEQDDPFEQELSPDEQEPEQEYEQTPKPKKKTKKKQPQFTQKDEEDLQQILDNMTAQEMQSEGVLEKPKLTRGKGYYRIKPNSQKPEYDDELTVEEEDDEDED